MGKITLRLDPRKSLRARVTALVGLTFLVAIVIVVLGVRAMQGRTRHELLREQAEVLESGVGRMVAGSLAHALSSQADIQELVRQFSNVAGIEAISLVDADGTIVADSDRRRVGSRLAAEELERMWAACSGEQVQVLTAATPFSYFPVSCGRGRSNDHPAAVVRIHASASLIESHGRIPGGISRALVASLSWELAEKAGQVDDLQRLVSDLVGFEMIESLAVYDRDGRLLVSRGESSRGALRASSPPMQVLQVIESAEPFFVEEGGRTACFLPIIDAAAPERAVLGAIDLELDKQAAAVGLEDDLMPMLIGSAVLLVAVSLALSWFLGRVVIRPLHRLSDAMGRVARDGFETIIPEDATDEVGLLTHSFNSMIQVLRKTTVSHEEVEGLLNSMTVGVLATTPNLLIRNVNRQICRMSGVAAEDLVGRSLSSLVDGVNLELIGNQALSAAGRRDHDAILTRSDGSRVPVALSGGPKGTGASGTPEIVWVVKDITQRKVAEDLAARRIEWLRRLSSLAMTLSGDPKDVFQKMSRMIAEMLDVPIVILTRVQGAELHVLSAYVDGDTHEDFGSIPVEGSPCEVVMASGDLCVFTEVAAAFPHFHLLRRFGAYSYCGIPSLDGAGRVVAMTTILDRRPHSFSSEDRDLLRILAQRLSGEIERQDRIEERRRAEEQQEKLESQLRQSQKMEAIGLLAGGVAHDFNNLLTVLLGNLECLQRRLLGRGEDDPEVLREMEEIRRAGDHAAALTRQLLTFSRKQVIKPEIFSLNERLLLLENSMLQLIREDVEITLNLEDEDPWVKADPGQIEQVILNLVINASEAMPTGGRLWIATRRVTDPSAMEPSWQAPGEAVCLEVRDTGIGMDEQAQRQIFEPFFTTKGREKGSGLGLAIVHGIVTQAGGRILVDSEVGRGTTFRVLLPASARAPETSEKKHDEPEWSDRCSGTILLCEDDEGVRRYVKRTLESRGYTVLEASGPERALATALEFVRPIDLLLTDVVMPKMSGRELARALAVERPDLSVLFMSGYTSGEIDQYGVVREGIHFLPKPFSSKELLAAVGKCIAGGGISVMTRQSDA